MGRLVLNWVCVLALVALPVGGCGDETTAAGGTGGSGDTGGDGGSGGTGGDGGTGGMGGMPECEHPDDCDDENECTGNACGNGMCEFAPVADDTACDESNECTVGVCADGACDSTPVANDTACGDDAGTCQQGSCRVACDEQGILDAIAAGGGPYTFDCDGPTTVVPGAPFVIDEDVQLNGEGHLTLDPGDFRIGEGAHVILRGLTILRGGEGEGRRGGGAIENSGTLTLEESTVSESCCWFAIVNSAVLRVQRSAIIGNPNTFGIVTVGGDTIIQNSTVTGNLGWDVWGAATEEVLIVNSTIGEVQENDATVTIRGSLVQSCTSEEVASDGYNIESDGDTCGFDQPTDQVNVSANDLKLGPLADNGGPTETHALGAGSVAIDVIPEAECVDAEGASLTTDQRGFPRDSMCDVGAFEVQP
ncbi:MAG: hypothetical protein DRH23_04445 [Deltaproteobacteria bacterium]|nr:MAG: hypothetical protein DRH23_04445 [Deltaproteobacteria bacterium]